jgi:hypothetical protein
MKLPEDWGEQDLVELISLKQEENLQLDFKRAESLDSTDKKKTEISKDVSAFANSAGGTIVYGISESAQEPRYAETLSPINPAKYPKEWLEQIINSRIQPRIQEVLINPVDLGSSCPGQYAYVVCIPQSTTAHQASDHRYYKRYNFESVAMEDYEVRQTMERASRAAYQIRMARPSRVSDRDGFRFATLSCVVENVSELVGRDVSAVLFLPKHVICGPDNYEVLVEDNVYSRIPGTWVLSTTSFKTAMDLHPVSPCQIFFQREVKFSSSLSSTPPLKAVVKVFDQFGLTLTTVVLLSIPDLEVVSTKEIFSSGVARRSKISAF